MKTAAMIAGLVLLFAVVFVANVAYYDWLRS